MTKQSDSQEESEPQIPNIPGLPNSPTTTADMGMTVFDMKNLNDLLTKGNLPASVRAIYLNGINTSLILARKGMPKLAKVYMDYASTNLKAMVGEKAGRIKAFLTPFELELHHEKRKDEEKPKI